jgi:hypothetical protein
MKCKDFFIIKVRTYADEKVLNKFHKTPGHEELPYPKQHYERAVDHNKFYWKFIEKVTGKGNVFWFREYMFGTKECVEDEIKESHGIIILDGEGWCTYLIPIKHVELIEWFKTNVFLPTKVLKKIRSMFYINHWGGIINKTRRTEEREHTIKYCKEHKITW